jgi:hypothetical protein
MGIFCLNQFVLHSQFSTKKRTTVRRHGNIGLMSKAESTHAIKSAAKVQLYHDILSKIFREFATLQTKGGLPY